MAGSICAFTSTRAEYGLLRPVLKALPRAHFNLQLIVSGTHLAKSYGLTVADILNDGLTINERVEIPLRAHSPTDICSSIGMGIARYGEALERLKPDSLMILGDRYEAFAAAAAATVHSIPIIHLHGGEVTEGANDDSFRHAITKMSHIHFASTETYRRRIIQLGENPSRTFNVGALGAANALQLPLSNQSEVGTNLQMPPNQRYFLATFHPATREQSSPEQQLLPLLEALDEFPNHVAVFTGANADAGGATINQILESHAKQHPRRFRFFMSLGSIGYLSAAKHADLVVGNSSSGIIEIPSFGVPTVDIGTRQAGRVRSESVISCRAVRKEIAQAIRTGLSEPFRAIARVAPNPYQGRNTVIDIIETLSSIEFNHLLQKPFFDQTIPTGVE